MQDKELIYNEDSGFANTDKLFNEEVHEAAVYEIEFKIFDKLNKNVIKITNTNTNINDLLIVVSLCKS